MTEDQIDILECLLNKIKEHLGHRVAIVSGAYDSWNIGAYDTKTNELKESAESYSLNEGVRLLKEKLTKPRQ